MDVYSVSGCLLIMGGIVLNICVFALLFRPLSFWETGNCINIKEYHTENRDELLNEQKIQEEERKELLTMNNENLCELRETGIAPEFFTKSGLSRTHSLTWFSNDVNKETMKSSYSDSNLYFKKKANISTKSPKCNCRQIIEAVGDSQKHSFLHWKMLKDPVFILLTVAIFLAIFGHHIVFNFIPPLADEFGFTESEGALCVSIVGLMDLIGRASCGVIGNAFFTRRIKLYIICLLVFATSSMIVIHVTNFYIFIVLCGMLGLSTGGYIGVKLSMIADELGKDNLPTAWGYIAFFTSFSILINPVIAGKFMLNNDELMLEIFG
jgi:hypothetical protein